MRQATLDKHPKLAEHLNALAAKLDSDIMAQLNARVDVERVAIETVASDFLEEQELK